MTLISSALAYMKLPFFQRRSKENCALNISFAYIQRNVNNTTLKAHSRIAGHIAPPNLHGLRKMQIVIESFAIVVVPVAKGDEQIVRYCFCIIKIHHHKRNNECQNALERSEHLSTNGDLRFFKHEMQVSLRIYTIAYLSKLN